MRDIAVDAVDEAQDIGAAAVDAVGDAGDALYRYSVQYMHEWGKLGLGLRKEHKAIGALLGALAAYHDDELAAFTFVFDR